MSRVGKVPVTFNDKVSVTIKDQMVTLKGAKTTETVEFSSHVEVKVEGQEIIVTRKDDSKQARARHGLYRALIQNAVTGVTDGFEKVLVLNGVGYRSAVKGKNLELALGYSHPIVFPIPAGITVEVVKQTTVKVKGSNKEAVGRVAAKIRSFRPPEPYLGKGVKYENEYIRRKAGKSAASK